MSEPNFAALADVALSTFVTYERTLTHVVAFWLRRMYEAGKTAERSRVVEIVTAQPFYSDTKIGMRQQWIKDQIVTAIMIGHVDNDIRYKWTKLAGNIGEPSP